MRACRHLIVGAVALAAVTAAPLSLAHAHDSTAGLNPAQLTSKTQVNGYLTHNHYRGYILLARRGRVILSNGYGLADSKHAKPNTIRTRWPMFGIESFMVAIAALKLQEQGKLSVREKLCAYVRGCPRSWRPITLDEVLIGNSGIGGCEDCVNPFAGSGSVQHTIALCMRQPLGSVPGKRPQGDSPCNRVLLSVVIAKASGKPFGAFLQRAIFRPAGMTRTNVESRIPADSARGYMSGSPAPPISLTGYPLVYSSVDDVARMDRALVAGKLLSAQSRRALFTPRINFSTPGDVPEYHGYGDQIARANEFPTHTTAPAQKVSPLKTNRVVSQGSGGPEGAGFDLQNLFSPDDGAISITVVNDPGSFSGDNGDALRDRTVRLLWAR